MNNVTPEASTTLISEASTTLIWRDEERKQILESVDKSYMKRTYLGHPGWSCGMARRDQEE